MINTNQIEESGMTLRNVTVRYGATTVRELLEHGYSLAPENADCRGMEYNAQSQTAMCGFFQGAVYMGELVFYNLSAKPDLSDLPGLSIDLALLWDDSLRAKTDKRAKPRPGHSAKKTFFKKLTLTLLIHGSAAALFFAAYHIPALLSVLRQSERKYNGGMSFPPGMLLLVLPAMLMVPVWGVHTPGGGRRYAGAPRALRIIGFSLWIILNVVFTAAYFFLIDASMSGI
ncbi:MAG: hypothetical protein LBC78_02370 [Oscillospiraceae bacterium]|nr:hypothetical protein [Oscillospiraceae bacterium]